MGKTKDVWTCEFCEKEFDTEKEAERHEKECGVNQKNSYIKSSAVVYLIMVLVNFFLLAGETTEFTSEYLVFTGFILLIFSIMCFISKNRWLLLLAPFSVILFAYSSNLLLDLTEGTLIYTLMKIIGFGLWFVFPIMMIILFWKTRKGRK